MAGEIKVGVPELKATLLPPAILGFAAHYIWIYCVMFALGQKLGSGDDGFAWSAASGYKYAVFAGTCLMLAVLMFTRAGRLLATGRPRVFIAIATIAALSTATLLASYALCQNSPGIVTGLALCASGLVAGACSGFLLASWGAVFRHMKFLSASMNLAAAFAIAIAAYGMLRLVPSALVFCVALILLQPLHGALRLGTNVSAPGTCEVGAPCSADEIERPASVYRDPYFIKLGAMLIIYGFMASVLRELAITSFRANANHFEYLGAVFLVVAIFALMYLLLYFFLNTRMREERNFPVVTIVLVAAAVVALYIIGDSAPLARQVVTSVTYLLFDTYLWTLLAQMAHDYRFPNRIVFGGGLLLTFVGQLLSPAIHGFSISAIDPLQLHNVADPVVLIFVLLVLSVLVSVGRNMDDALGSAEASPAPEQQPDPEANAGIAAVAQRYLLTAREEQIAGMLICGRSVAKISERFAISENTAKTHIKRIYRKIDVHSKQELIDLVETERDTGWERGTAGVPQTGH